MSNYIMGQIEILELALKHTDIDVILSGSADWIEPRVVDCMNCGEINADGVRQAERDEVCLEICRQCDEIVEERLLF